MKSIIFLSALLATVKATPIRRGDDDWISPQMATFVKPLVLPTFLTPITTYVNETTNEIFDFYQMTISPLTQEIYAGKNTNLQGYNGEVPGPVIKTTTGRRSVVRFINQVPNPASIQ